MNGKALEVGRAAGLFVLVAAAVLEVAGDALIRKGMRGSGIAVAVAGVAALGAYGVLVNVLNVDFSRTLGAYVGCFAVTSIVVGRLAFREQVSGSTWLGLAVILFGSLIIHVGRG